jgi:hypothetical protein
MRDYVLKQEILLLGLSDFLSLNNVRRVTILYWSFACSFYCLKFVSNKIDKTTSYGKQLEAFMSSSSSSSSSTPIRQAQRGNSIIKILLNCIFSDWITHRVAWPLFYGLAWILNSIWLIILASPTTKLHMYPSMFTYPSEPPTSFSSNSKFNFNSLTFILTWSFFQMHVTKRFLESIAVHQYSHRFISFFNFIAGLSYYFFVTCSIATLSETTLFYHLSSTSPSPANPSIPSNAPLTIPSPPSTSRVILSSLLFTVGSIIQCWSHILLASLRSSSSSSSSSTCPSSSSSSYFIPRGGLFGLVSSPHYLGEILVYFSFLTMTSFSNLCLNLSFLFVVLNLTHGAIKTHSWYNQHWGDRYPNARKALIPFLL